MRWIKVKRSKGVVDETTQKKMMDKLPIIIMSKYYCPEGSNHRYEIIVDASDLIDYKIFYDENVVKFAEIK